MKLPAGDRVTVPRDKIVDYLLSAGHPCGRSKARFFRQFGFTPEVWKALADALRQHVVDHKVRKVEESPFGVRYTIEGWLNSPDGRNPSVRSVWFVGTEETAPRFVTAYPIARRRA